MAKLPAPKTQEMLDLLTDYGYGRTPLPPTGGFQNPVPTLPKYEPLPDVVKDTVIAAAETMCDRIEQAIVGRTETLMEGYELRVESHSPNGEMIDVEDFGYFNPNLLYIYGHDRLGNPVQVLASSTSVHLVLRSVPKIEDQERRPIGFLGEIAD